MADANEKRTAPEKPPPIRRPTGLPCRDAVRLVDEHFLGVRSSTAFPDPDPACLV
jgi:hypothetical protein